jgi:hypothetical protein
MSAYRIQSATGESLVWGFLTLTVLPIQGITFIHEA